MSAINESQSSAEAAMFAPKTSWSVGAESLVLRDDGRWYRGKITDAGDDMYRVRYSAVYISQSFFHSRIAVLSFRCLFLPDCLYGS